MTKVFVGWSKDCQTEELLRSKSTRFPERSRLMPATDMFFVAVDQMNLPPSWRSKSPSLVKLKTATWLRGLSGLADQTTGSWLPETDKATTKTNESPSMV